jgi:vancomycin resistance protein VanJ
MKKGRVGRVLWAAALAYAAWIGVWFALWLAVRDGAWWLALINRVVPQMLAPAPVMVMLALARRSRTAVVASLAPLLILGILYWPYLIPRVARSADGPALKLMTFNVLFSNTDHDAVADVILRYRPDLVALQEVQPEMMAALIERLKDVYPFYLMGAEHPYGTTAAFSRHSLLDAYVLDLQADRPAVVLTVDVAGRPVTFISAHLLAYGLEWIPPLEFPTTVTERIAEQERQARLLIDEVRKHDDRVILACDCNSKETSGAYRILTDHLTSAARVVGWVLAEPTFAGAQRDTDLQHIDYVFYRGDLSAVEADLIRDTAGSDHLPVLAVVEMTKEE